MRDTVKSKHAKHAHSQCPARAFLPILPILRKGDHSLVQSSGAEVRLV